MKKSNCPVCTREKGRRDCLLKDGAVICSRCCAEMRTVDTCDDCAHFVQAEGHALTKMKNSNFASFCVELDPEVELAVDRALQILEEGDLTTAEKRLRSLLEKHPQNHLVHYGLGCVHGWRENYQDSIRCFERSVQIFPYFLEGWHNWGISCQKVFDVAGAIKCALKVIELGDSEYPPVREGRSFLKDMRKSIESSGLTLEQYVQGADLFDEAFQHMENGRIEAAMKGFQKVIALDHHHVPSYGNLGICHALSGERKLALMNLDKALELDPDYELARDNREIVEALAEGERLPGRVASIDYARVAFEREKKSGSS
jgi:tetratricopeptide (TPR) repeat protein